MSTARVAPTREVRGRSTPVEDEEWDRMDLMDLGRVAVRPPHSLSPLVALEVSVERIRVETNLAGGGEQRRDDLDVALLAGDVQRRGAVLVDLTHIGVRSEQHRDDLGVALLLSLIHI